MIREQLHSVFNSDESEEKKCKESHGADALSEKFLKTRQILLSGGIDKESAEKVIRQLLVLEADSDKPIYLFINSPGGDVSSGFAIFDTIRFINAPVYTIGAGDVASAGALIFLASSKERRLSLPNSSFLIHQPLISGVYKGVATDVEIFATEMEKTRAKINKIIADETGVSFEKVEKDTDRDYWLSAEEALEYGLVGKIISHRSEITTD